MKLDEYLIHGDIGLGRGDLLRIEDACALLVQVWQGEVWITQEGDARDIVLGRGESFRIDRPGRVLVQAVTRSSVALASPRASGFARRIQVLADGMAWPALARDRAPGWHGWHAVAGVAA